MHSGAAAAKIAARLATAAPVSVTRRDRKGKSKFKAQRAKLSGAPVTDRPAAPSRGLPLAAQAAKRISCELHAEGSRLATANSLADKERRGRLVWGI